MDNLPKFEDTTEVPPPFEQTQEVNTNPPPFEETEPPTAEKYSTPMQQAATVGEGLAQGVMGPVATYAEKKLGEYGVPGMSQKDIAGRRETNPGEFSGAEVAGLTGSMLTGTGEAGLIAKGLEHLPQASTALAKIGSQALKGAIQMGLIQGGDEISKAMLGEGDPVAPVSSALANVGASGLLGGAFGLGFSSLGKGASKALSYLEDTKLGNKLTSFIAGLGHAATYPNAIIATPENVIADAENLHMPSFKAGQKAFPLLTNKLASKAAKYGLESVGYSVGSVPGLLAGQALGESIEDALGGTLNKNISKTAGKYIGPAMLKLSSSGGTVSNIGGVVDYATSMAKGAQKINKGVEALFKAGGNEALDFEHSEKDREKLREFIENGGIDEEIRQKAQQEGIQRFAQGGQVTPEQSNPIETHFPEQNILLSAAKGRISGYLNSIRPVKNPMKLPYDSEHKDFHKEREYNKMLDFANQPLSVLKHIKDGSLMPSHVSAMNQMYPELYSHLSKKITGEMAKTQMDEEKKPPYKVRQALSLFLGSSLDSTVTPQGIMAAQNVFAQQKAIRAQPNKVSALAKTGAKATTPEQARIEALKKA